MFKILYRVSTPHEGISYRSFYVEPAPDDIVNKVLLISLLGFRIEVSRAAWYPKF